MKIIQKIQSNDNFMPEWQVNDLIKEIQDSIYNVSTKILKTMGWDMSDIADYFVVDVSETEPGIFRAEIRGELDYEELSKLCDKLDKVISTKFDKDAYFEPVEPGIAEAFIRTGKEIYSNISTSAKTKKVYITRYGAFDNGHIFHDFKKMTEEQAQEAARQASIKDPTDAYYVHYDDIMNPTGDIVWVNGVPYYEWDVRPYGDSILIEEGAQPAEVVTASTEIRAYTFDESEDGWGEDIEDILSDVFDKTDRFIYEIRNTVRGAYTDCETVEDLAEYIRNLASEFEEAADEIESL